MLSEVWAGTATQELPELLLLYIFPSIPEVYPKLVFQKSIEIISKFSGKGRLTIVLAPLVVRKTFPPWPAMYPVLSDLKSVLLKSALTPASRVL